MTRQLYRLTIVLLSCGVGCQTTPLAKQNSSQSRQESPTSDSLVKSPFGSTPSLPVTTAARIDVMLATARSLEASQQYADAMQAYEKILKIEPNEPHACHRLAVVQDRSGRPDLAAPYYQRAMQLAPADASLHCDYGYSCYLRRDWDASEQHLRRAIELQPTLRRAQVNLGMLLARSNRENEGLQMFAKAGLSEAEARNNLAFALSLNRRLGDAADQYAQAVELDPRLKRAQQSSRELQQVRARIEPPTGVMPASYQARGMQLRDEVRRLPEDLSH